VIGLAKKNFFETFCKKLETTKEVPFKGLTTKEIKKLIRSS